jgi:exodeoxyribonuclease V gamma subunit
VALLAGVDGNTAIKAEIARGSLPPEVLGVPVINDVYPIANAIAQEASKLIPEGAAVEPLDVRVTLADGRLLNGTVSGVHGDMLLTTTYSRVAAKHRLAAWVRLLALSATHPERDLSSATVGRARGNDVRIAFVATLGDDPERREQVARRELERLVDLYARGMREPLPIYCATSAAYAGATAIGQDPAEAAGGEWESGYNWDREDRELEHRLVLGGVLRIAELLEPGPRSDESGDGWTEAETSRVGRLARRLWDGLLVREELWSR